jgi:hypothetical protein
MNFAIRLFHFCLFFLSFWTNSHYIHIFPLTPTFLFTFLSHMNILVAHTPCYIQGLQIEFLYYNI